MNFRQQAYAFLRRMALGEGQIWLISALPKPFLKDGQLQRDFTYIDDIVEGVVRVLDKPAMPEAGGSHAPHRVFNIDNHEPIALLVFIETLEKALGREAIKNLLPMQLGNVHATHADTTQLQEWVEFVPNTPLKEGIENFVAWYHSRYKPANLNKRAG